MNQINNLDDVLQSIEDLRDSIKFSNDLFPIMKDLFIFLKDMIPLLLEANVSIKESTKRLPDATDNINNVSKMTETSTNQVLDSIETITGKLGELRVMMENSNDKNTQLDMLDEVSNLANEMVFAFQFQDITTQKLEHTSRILKTVHDKFAVLFKSFDKMRANSEIGSDVARAIELEFNRESAKGNHSKDYFEENSKDIMHHNTEISQDDIDSFFK